MKEPRQPWMPVDYDIADAASIQALIRGDANEHQQQRAIKWIIEIASCTYDQSFYPGGGEGARNTDFAEGRRFVGNSILKLSKLNLSSLRGQESENE